jgi:hypothetical protein
MAEFSNKIIDVFYFNEEKTVVNVEWRGSDEKIRRFFVQVDEKDHNYRDLVAEGWDHSRIQESTKEYQRRARKGFEKEVMLIAEREGLIDNNDFSFKKMYEFVTLTEEDVSQEELFKFKIEAFDHPKVVGVTDPAVKRDIRKAKTYKEVLDLVLAIEEEEIEENEE